MKSKKRYMCRFDGCEKHYASTSARLYHERKVHGHQWTKADKISIEKTESATESINVESNESDNNIVEIKTVEFQMAKKKLNKEESEEFEYECGSCGAEFNTRHKYCPECGIRFSG